MQPGFAAKAALMSVQLARRKVRGAQATFDGADGFLRVYLRDRCDRDVLREGLGIRRVTARTPRAAMAAVIETAHLPTPGVESRGRRGIAADVFAQAVHDDDAAARGSVLQRPDLAVEAEPVGGSQAGRSCKGIRRWNHVRSVGSRRDCPLRD